MTRTEALAKVAALVDAGLASIKEAKDLAAMHNIDFNIDGKVESTKDSWDDESSDWNSSACW